jgi:putative transposase
LLRVIRYVERNPLRANKVERAEQWRWCSLWRRLHLGSDPPIRLHAWPVPEPERWIETVNEPETPAEVEALRLSVSRGSPFGHLAWREATARRLGLEYTFRRRGRPKKEVVT